MQWLARWIARRLWWASLWLMRRPAMRRVQTASFRWLPPKRAEQARLGLVRQNALARRIGLKTIYWLVLACLVSLAAQIVYATATHLVESGVLRPHSADAAN